MSPLERLKELVRPYYLRWIYFPTRPQRRPPHFSECWQHPRLDLASGVPAGGGLIFYPMNDWHSRLQRSQHLAVEFARRGRRVVYLNPHLGRQFETTPVFDRAHRLCEIGENLFELHVRLPREPVFHHRLLTAGESRLISAAVRRVAGRSDWIQVVSFPIWFEAARQLRKEVGWPVIYDCHDLLPGFGNIATEIVEYEAFALREADLVVFSSERLMRECIAGDPGLERRALLLRNAVDSQRFEAFSAGNKKNDVAVYAGALAAWFDVPAVAEAARTNPHCHFLIIGRVDDPLIDGLSELPNVQLAGEVPYAQLPAMLACGRVGLIPFRVNELTLATNPIKLYEYFSLGLPVVSAPLPEVEAFGDLVYVASTPVEFAEAVRQALQEDDPLKRARRKQVASVENWAQRVGVLEARLGSLAQ